ncbi:MAG: P-II family nitrogen regulator [Lachnospiraceae bacterium]
MKMVMAIVRPNSIMTVSEALAEAGFYASTKWSVSGRGKQRGIQVGDMIYDEMAKNMLMVMCEDEDKNKVIDVIMESAITGENGHAGDGKIFVLPVEESYTISEQAKDE